MRPSPLVLSPVLALVLLAGSANAQTVRIPLPKRTKPTPVQKFNQDGVKAIQHRKFDQARKLFYKAYLLDPDDPFTLNNLGYLSELNGDIDRAQRYYELAAENTSDATIDRSTLDNFKGKKVSEVAGHAADTQMQINRYNVQAMGLLMKDRAPEADLVLAKALELDPKNPFTLNNLGYAKEKEGEFEKALSFYTEAANSNSDQKIIVAVNKDWRGRKISDVAHRNVNALQKLMAKEDSTEAKVARLNLEGVSAMNRNDRATARQYFERAYKLDPADAFTLNNMGYVSEMDGDRETADFYYAKAQDAKRSKVIAAVATRKDVEGKPVRNVAEFGDTMITARMEAAREERIREAGNNPVLLKSRDGADVTEPDKAPEPAKDEAGGNPEEAPRPGAQPNEIILPPVKGVEQPSAQPTQPQPATEKPAAEPPQPVGPPEPYYSNQPPATNQPPRTNTAPSNPNPAPTQPVTPPPTANQPPSGQSQIKTGGYVLAPLPDNQQPTTNQPPSKAQPQIKTGGDVLEPLPDNQQPPAAKQPTTPKPPKN